MSPPAITETSPPPSAPIPCSNHSCATVQPTACGSCPDTGIDAAALAIQPAGEKLVAVVVEVGLLIDADTTHRAARAYADVAAARGVSASFERARLAERAEQYALLRIATRGVDDGRTVGEDDITRRLDIDASRAGADGLELRPLTEERIGTPGVPGSDSQRAGFRDQPVRPGLARQAAQASQKDP